MLRMLKAMWERWAARRELLGLSERDLRDIGLSRYDVLVEARKPPWRP